MNWHWVRILGAAVSAVLLIASCAGKVSSKSAISLAVKDINPDRAVAGQNHITVKFALKKKSVALTANWLTKQPETGQQFAHHAALLDLVEKADHLGQSTPRPGERVYLATRSDWNRLAAALVNHLVPQESNQGVRLSVQNYEMVVFRNAGGQISSLPLEQTPTTLPIISSYNNQSFAEAAAEMLTGYLKQNNLSEKRMLFPVGRASSVRSQYWYVDLERRQSIFLSTPVDPEYQGGSAAGFALSSANALVFRSHILTLVKNPFTSVGRLINLAGASAYSALAGNTFDQSEPPPLAHGPSMDLVAWERELDQLTDRHSYPGRVSFLIDGEAFFSRWIEAVQRAAESLDIRVYIFDRDDYAVRMADLLKARSKEVKVRVLMDQIGSLVAGNLAPAETMPDDFVSPPSIVTYLRADSEIRVRQTTNPWFTADHTKTLFVDDHTAFVGGMNIGRQYRYEWHDLMMEVSGPIVDRLHKDFAMTWAHTGYSGDLGYALTWMKRRVPRKAMPAAGEILIRPLYTGTMRHGIFTSQLAAIQRARNYIYIENAYLASQPIVAALIHARRRGVDVRVVLPSVNDSGIMHSSNVVLANRLLTNGIRVFVYPGMTHVKAAIYDGWACVGSANFDKISLFVNQETNLAFSDPEAVGRLKAGLFEVDFGRSTELTEPISVGWSDLFYTVLAGQL